MSSNDLLALVADKRKKEVKTLLDKGVDPNVADKEGRTPLHYAAFTDQKDIIQLLIKKKANIDAADVDGKSPLLMACHLGHFKCANALIKSHADIKSITRHNDNILHMCARQEKWNKAALKVIKLALDAGVSPALCSHTEGRTPIFDAADRDYSECCIAMLRNRPDVNACAATGENAGFAAIRNNNPALLRALLDVGLDVRSRNGDGQTIPEAASAVNKTLYDVLRGWAKTQPGGERILRQQTLLPPAVAKCYAELPDDIKKLVHHAKLPVDKIDANWAVFCTVMSFGAKRKIVADEDEANDAAQAQALLEAAAAAAADEAAGSAGGSGRGAEAIKRSGSNASVSNSAPASDQEDKEARKAAKAAKKAKKAAKPISMSAGKLAQQNLITPGNPKTLFNAKKMEMMGKGGFGMVFAAADNVQKAQVAIKRMPNISDRDKKSNLREIYFLRECVHPNIVKFYHAYEDTVDREIWVVMELMEGGTLDEAVHTGYDFKESHIIFVASEICKGLVYLHSRNIAHRDLKAANVMMTVNGEVKLIDFGLATEMGPDGSRLEMLGSPYWMPPEMIRRQPHNTQVDIWSTGVCLLELANHEPPSRGSAVRCLWNYAVEAPPGLSKPDKYSGQFRDLISKMLLQDPALRATPQQVLDHGAMSSAAKQADMRNVLRQIFMTEQLRGNGFF